MPDKSVALIMAGGEGTRMAQTRPAVPKPLVDLGGIPLIEIMIRQLLNAGFGDIRLALRHKADMIIDHIKKLPDIEQDCLKFIVEKEPLGTIGSLAQLRDLSRTVLVANGDLLSGLDLKRFIEFHRQEGADMTIATHTEYHRLTLGEVISGPDCTILDYLEKPVKSYRISSGIYLIEPPLLALCKEREWLQFPNLVKTAIEVKLKILEHYHTEPWLDINNEADLAQAREMFLEDPVAFGIDPDLVKA
ncbi:MAG: NTP transferase domain-containing protein [Planctomycetes bacterium]|nr:NTP transferase domain-containing protein [Planctomycetota bacterium]